MPGVRAVMRSNSLRMLSMLAVSCVAVYLATGCSDATGPARDGPLSVTVHPGALIILNAGSTPLHTFALSQRELQVVDWIPCTDPTRCPGLAPSARRELPYSQISGFAADTRDVRVYGWHLAPNGTGFAVSDMYAVTVRIRWR
jgi:hypothetical protein